MFYEVEKRLTNDLADISDWAGKFVGAVLRIAALLHMAQNPSMPMFVDVSGETMKSAVRIGRYFLEHAKAAYSLMGADTVNKNAEYLLDAIISCRAAVFASVAVTNALTIVISGRSAPIRRMVLIVPPTRSIVPDS